MKCQPQSETTLNITPAFIFFNVWKIFPRENGWGEGKGGGGSLVGGMSDYLYLYSIAQKM